MKIIYIEAKNKKESNGEFIDENFIKTLPNEIFLLYSIQFYNQALAMKKALETSGIRVKGFQQVLGCTKLKTQYPILLIGQGRFHALNLAVQNPQNPLIIYDNGSSFVITKKEIQEIEKKRQLSLNKFLHAKNIGILVSTKPGQENLKQAEELQNKINKKYPEKKIFIFISNMINTSEFENFDIDIFINTACPGLARDSSKVINSDDIYQFL